MVKQTKSKINVNNIQINWENICKLNGPLLKYVLYLNNQTIYNGSKTYYANDFIIDCVNNLLKIGEIQINLGLSLVFRIEAYTTEGLIENDFYSIEYNCTSNL